HGPATRSCLEVRCGVASAPCSTPLLLRDALKSYARAMKIYTRTGDAGETGLFGGARVEKDDPRVEAYGTVDELNSCLGVARALGVAPQTDASLLQIQGDLFTLGAELACVAGKEEKLRMALVSQADIQRLEGWIDQSEGPLEPLKHFVLPGGSPSAAELHRARTVCRRAERRTLTAGRISPIRPEVVIYLNRLSDLLFVLARYENHTSSVVDIPWHAR
ncbi:MAG: cob(I)yrinic acid a,c-diamide adenosyltransferase, partial [Pseudomonadota bacterium]